MKASISKSLLIFSLTILSACSEKNENPNEINIQLQQLELEIYEKISKKQKDEALILLRGLIHPSDEKWKEKQKQSMLESIINGGNQYYSYNEWWTTRRDELRDVILLEEPIPERKSIDNSNIDFTTSDEKSPLIILDRDFVGVYSNQSSSGRLRFYKVLNISDSYTKVIYQDNEDGKVTIIMYIVESFQRSENEVIIYNEKNRNEKIKLKFIENIANKERKSIIDPLGQIFNTE
jgi:hypothetical protein